MNLKDKLIRDNQQLSEMKIEQIIEEWIRQLIREEVEKYFDDKGSIEKNVPFKANRDIEVNDQMLKDAMEEASKDTDSEELKDLPDDAKEIIDVMLDQAMLRGETPTLSQIVEEGVKRHEVYKHFNGYKEACKIAGLEVNSGGDSYSN
jgi:chromosome condensin MukBEF complex kleisin-like MukF subunit